ncbi:MAG TPA: glucose-6-phosphate dehydrogenase [Blastocatellia bacterium]|nr:glucose-6-phosphate dehydrogenase [Blastocatellia bacterium]
MRLERTADPCTVVIFGASGDLTKRKLVPALYHLAQNRLLPAEIAVIGVARRETSDEDFRTSMRASVIEFSGGEELDEAVWSSFAAGLYYVSGEFDDPATYARLGAKLAAVEPERGTAGNRVFYLSTAPSAFSLIVDKLGDAKLVQPDGAKWRRVIIEKPIGHSLESAIELNENVSKVLTEDQVYRIDHYLGKETVQNLLAFRFANGIFEPLWNRNYVDNVQVTNAETVGVEGRGSYYEGTGVVRDMIQNHVFQVLSVVAMEPPINLKSDSVRDEKIKVMEAVKAITHDAVPNIAVRGQYGPGHVAGKSVPGYREETGVAPDSPTETFASLKLTFDNWRWAGVPFYIRSGKRCARRITEIAIQFKEAPHRLFGDMVGGTIEQNVLIIRIQPNEGITLRFDAKVPGQTTTIRGVNMDFRYGSSFGARLAEAYERLILDCILGDSTLFARRDMTQRGWEIVTPILDRWAEELPGNEFPNYEAGSWGPKASDDLLARAGHRWRRL